MEEEKPGIHIDTDWKKQAQEEKKKLAEQEQSRRAGTAAPSGAGAGAAGKPGQPGAGTAAKGARELPPASFGTLVQSLMTQVLFYLGDLAPRGGEASMNLDMAKHLIDTIAMLEEKTANNLTDEEKRLLDAALYETRMRYVNVASQFTGP